MKRVFDSMIHETQISNAPCRLGIDLAINTGHAKPSKQQTTTSQRRAGIMHWRQQNRISQSVNLRKVACTCEVTSLVTYRSEEVIGPALLTPKASNSILLLFHVNRLNDAKSK